MVVRVEALVQLAKQNLSNQLVLKIRNGGITMLGAPLKGSTQSPSLSLIELCKWLDDLANQLMELRRSGQMVRLSGISISTIEEFMTRLQKINDLSRLASDEWQATMEEGNADGLFVAVPNMIAFLRNERSEN